MMAKSTRFAGSNEPVQIFQDDMFENGTPMNCHAPMPAVTKPSRRPLSSSNSNVVLNPPSSSGSGHSPYKSKSSSSPNAPLKASRGNKLNMVPMAPPMNKGPTTDSLQKKPYLSKFKTGPQKPAVDASYIYGKENRHPQIFPAPATINLSVESYYQKPNGKRGLMDAAPIRDSRPAKKVKTEEDDLTLPPHDSFPPIADDGAKPAHSYAQLIGMAILRSPMRRLTLAQIYKWISDTYSFYNPNDAGWQNSIRHNLSLHKNFIKIERPKDDPGKGNYWGIEPGTEFQFLKEKPTRKSAPTAENLPVMSTRLEPSRPTHAHAQEPALPLPLPMSQVPLPPFPTAQALPAEVSSDATIPGSDQAAPEDGDKSADNDVPLDSSLYSPLPAAMHSSPPVPRHMERRAGTPPPLARHQPTSSATRSHKRKFASMDDSGYISSLESSAMRPNKKAMLLTSEADRPRIKRGRAEEEIARLRGSSPFSPTKPRAHTSYGPVSSSPLRQAHEHQMLPPLTPMVKMKPPVRPPPSASPNTNLRIHRDKVRHMLQSPLRRVTGAGDDSVPWSPAFNLDETAYNLDDVAINAVDFDIFRDLTTLDDNVFASMSSVDTGSPVKRSTKRLGLDRSVSTSALGDITNLAARKSVTSAPFLKAADPTSFQFLETPSKVFEGMSSPSRLFQQSPIRNRSPSKFSGLLEIPADGDWPALLMDPSEFITGGHVDATDFSGLDILQGFEKIGSGSQAAKLPRGDKPHLGRSYSTNF